jgi:hypothetical protein
MMSTAVSKAPAQTTAPVNWKSPVSGNWTTAADWSSGGVPTPADDITIGTAGAYTVTLNAAASVNSLTVSDVSATLAIVVPTGTVRVAGSFSNSGFVAIDTTGYGGTTVKIGGVLTNSGSVTIGSAAVSGGFLNPTFVSAGGLANTGHLVLWGPFSTVLDINTAAALGGTVELHGNSMLEFASGAITAIASGTTLVEDSGAASVALASDPSTANSALTRLAGNAGTLMFENGAALATSVDFNNSAITDIDTAGSGGSALAIGGTLTNKGSLDVGNSGLIADAAVSAAALSNSGSIYLQSDIGAATLSTAGNFVNANGANVFIDSYYLDAGGSNITVGGTLTNSGGFYIGNGSAATPTTVTVAALDNRTILELANGAALITTADLTNTGSLYVNYYYYYYSANIAGTSLDVGGKLSNSGYFYIANYGGETADIAVTGAFANNATTAIDNAGFGGSTLAAGSLTNGGYLYIGSTTLSKPTLVQVAANLVNTGYLSLTGSATVAATLDVGGAAPTTLSGSIHLAGDALLEFGSGGVTGIGGGAQLSLDGPKALVTVSGHLTSNSALTGLSTNAGALILADGAAVATTSGLTNSGTAYIDSYYYYASKGGSSLSIGGTLTNNKGTIYIGYYGNNTTSTAVRAAALNNSGYLLLDSGTSPASLKIGGAVGNTGTIEVDAIYSYIGGSTLSAGATLTNGGSLYIGNSSLSKATNASAAALSNTNFIELTSGAAAARLQVSGNAGNSGRVYVDTYGSGGSKLNVGGTLTNSGAFYIGNSALTKRATVTAASLVNTGSIALDGGPSGTATLSVAGPSPTTIGTNQYLDLIGNALLEFASGGLTGIASGGQLALGGPKALVALSSAPTSNSALTKLANNAGYFYLTNGAAVATTVGLTNNYVLQVDASGSGGSSLRIGGALTNKSYYFQIGNSGLTSPTLVTAAALSNASALYLYSGTAAAKLGVAGAFANTGTVEVDYGGAGGSTLAIGGTLTNSGGFYIGSTSLTRPTLVMAAGLANTGTIYMNEGAAATATLDITGAAPVSVAGNFYLAGNALLEFASGGPTGIASGGQLALGGPKALVALSSAPTSNSALTKLANNAGYFYLTNGAAVATTVGLTNNYVLQVDASGSGGSSLSIGGALTNSASAAIYAGSSGLTAASKIAATSLTNNGNIYLAGGAGKAAETMSLAGASSDAGYILIYPGGVLALGGSLKVAGTLYVDGGTLSGGTLAASGFGVVESAGTATLNNVAIAAGTTFTAQGGSQLVDNGISVNGALYGSGSATLDFAKTGTESLANVSGFSTIGLANGGANMVNLAAANFAGVGNGRIAVVDGNSGNTVNAANLPAADAIVVRAGAGRDVLTGGAGDDVFYAGGNTAITGGGGANQFVFTASGVDNMISDFHVSATNTLVFSNSGFNLGLGGATSTPQPLAASAAATLFTANSTGGFANTAQRLAYDTSNGELFASRNGSASTPKLIATLTDHAPISAATQLFFIS